MKLKAALLVLLVIALTHPFFFGGVEEIAKKPTNPILVAQSKESATSEPVITIESKQLDPRAKILTAYFEKYDSPLSVHSQDFIDAADFYGVDWKLVPSIAGTESTFGKHIPGGYNAWGWGVYGDQSLGFNSWRDGIFTVTGGLKNNYINKGLTEPYAMNKVYASSPTWGAHVSYFIADLEKFSNNYPKDTQEVKFFTIAGSSAQLK